MPMSSGRYGFYSRGDQLRPLKKRPFEQISLPATPTIRVDEEVVGSLIERSGKNGDLHEEYDPAECHHATVARTKAYTNRLSNSQWRASQQEEWAGEYYQRHERNLSPVERKVGMDTFSNFTPHGPIKICHKGEKTFPWNTHKNRNRNGPSMYLTWLDCKGLEIGLSCHRKVRAANTWAGTYSPWGQIIWK